MIHTTHFTQYILLISPPNSQQSCIKSICSTLLISHSTYYSFHIQILNNYAQSQSALLLWVLCHFTGIARLVWGMTVSAKNATPPRSTKSGNSNSSAQIQITPKFQSQFVPRDIEESKFVDLVDFGGVVFQVESVIDLSAQCSPSCNTLQHTATHCNTRQHTATYCNTLQHTATHCNILQHTATHCNVNCHRSKCSVLTQLPHA